jgi:hypothetical protein
MQKDRYILKIGMNMFVSAVCIQAYPGYQEYLGRQTSLGGPEQLGRHTSLGDKNSSADRHPWEAQNS